MAKNKPEDVFKFINMQGGDTEKCWPWTASINKSDGRPYFTAEGVKKAAYVWAKELHSGELAEGRMGLHSCDNKVCCNPYHLTWGTHQENMDEMKERERHGMPRIVIEAWIKMRSAGKTLQEIGDAYGVSAEAVRLRLDQEKEKDNGSIVQAEERLPSDEG